MNKFSPERLFRWILGHTQPVKYSLNLDHPVMNDIAWAADEIALAKSRLEMIRDAAANGVSLVWIRAVADEGLRSEPLVDLPNASTPQSGETSALPSPIAWTPVMRREVVVCSACERASCWQGEFMCDSAERAGTKRLSIHDLTTKPRGENAEYWFKDGNGVIDYGSLDDYKAQLAASAQEPKSGEVSKTEWQHDEGSFGGDLDEYSVGAK